MKKNDNLIANAVGCFSVMSGSQTACNVRKQPPYTAGRRNRENAGVYAKTYPEVLQFMKALLLNSATGIPEFSKRVNVACFIIDLSISKHESIISCTLLHNCVGSIFIK